MGDLSEHSQSQLSKLHYSSPFLFTGNPHLFHADFQTRSFGFSELLIPSKQPRISLALVGKTDIRITHFAYTRRIYRHNRVPAKQQS